MARPRLARDIVRLIGHAATMRSIDSGWPSQVDLLTSRGLTPVSLHVSKVSPHSREHWEWRFQNPGSRSPVLAPAVALPILVGLDVVDGQNVLIVVDGRSRLGRVKRFSILFNKRISQEAARLGWSEQISATGEHIYALRPHLLPLLVEVIAENVDVPIRTLVDAAASSGLLEDDTESAGERARRTVSTYIRDVRFSRDVRSAYEHRCSMCRVGLGLVVGAHIFPVNAPGAPDRVWNGIAVCYNHHAAFDSYRVWISADYSVHLKPELTEIAAEEPESLRFLEQTRDRLWLPEDERKRPRRDMFERRYAYYQEQYDWAPRF